MFQYPSIDEREKMKSVAIIIGAIAISSILMPSAYAEHILIARGALETLPKPDSEMTSARYRIIETGRGEAGTNVVTVIYMTTLQDERHLPSDAILLLEGVRWGKLSESKERGVFVALGHDPNIGILPYTEQAWKTMLQKSDEELSATPSNAQLPKEKAVALLRGRIHEKYGMPRHIYVYPPRRVPFGWSIAALCVRNSAVKKLTARISDQGRIISEIPNHYPIKFFDSTDVSAEEMELFIRDYHRNTPPDEWPTWDPEPPSSMPESAADEHEASVLPSSGAVSAP